VVVDLPPEDAPQPGVASLPPSTGPLSDGDNMRIVFDQDSSKLPQDARDALKALSDQLKGQENLRLQLLAYAGTADTSASAARRLSLSRALAVRSHLIESGVRSTRIDVRALGNKSSDEVTERVDITVVER
jgi:outer membrane protein OmpA-like peptidoglycan-associated protein